MPHQQYLVAVGVLLPLVWHVQDADDGEHGIVLAATEQEAVALFIAACPEQEREDLRKMFDEGEMGVVELKARVISAHGAALRDAGGWR